MSESGKELEWLASNRQNYAGQWVALQEGRLLAAGPDAGEVFSKVRYMSPPALVVRISEEDLPFAGW
jgi:hypothetical protein